MSARSLGATDGEHVLSGIDLDLYEGEWLGVLGPRGAGKGLLLQLLARARVPEQGELQLADELIAGTPGDGRVSMLRVDADSAALSQLRSLGAAPHLLLIEAPAADRGAAFSTTLAELRAWAATAVVASRRPCDVERTDRILLLDRGYPLALASPAALKSDARAMARVAIDSPHPIAAAAANALAARSSFQLEGNRLLLLLPARGSRAKRVVDAARLRGVEISRIRIAEPSLASVYYDLSGQELDAGCQEREDE